MGSLKLRLALTSALLIALSVAVTVIHSVRVVVDRSEETIFASNLGAAQLAAALSAAVVEHQRALDAAARSWPRDQAADAGRVQAFLEHQVVLRTLFDGVLIAPAASLPASRYGEPQLLPVGHAASAAERQDIVLSRPLATGGAEAQVLAGTLQLGGGNFLSYVIRESALDELRIQSVLADQQGRVLAHADESRLLTRVDDDPSLKSAVARWRQQGSPLEATPWTGRDGELFVAMAAVPGTDWMLFRVGRVETLFGGASRSITRTIALGAAVGLVGAVAIFGFTAWLLRPLGELRQRALLALDPAQPAGQGWPDAGGEVGELSRVLRHVSEQLATSQADVQESLQRMQAVLAHAPVGIAFADEERIKLASHHLEQMLGYGPGELNFHWGDLLAPEAQLDVLREQAESTFLLGRNFEVEVPLSRRDGSVLWTHVQGAAIFGVQRWTIWIVSDATAARQQRQDLIWSASHDALTELVNRREFEQRLGHIVADRRRHAAACTLFIDLDHFKQVNDGAGHAAGDTILKKVARVLRDCVRSGDTVSRLGGDEFAVLLPGCDLDRALLIAEKIRYGIALEGVCDSDATLRVTASIGAVEIDDRPLALSDVLEAADRACYAAKHAGRNAVRCASLGVGDAGRTSAAPAQDA